MLIFLIGFMGSGKSHLGKKLASLLNYQFIDTDELIEQKKKQSITSIFEVKGEEYFRELERKTLRKLVSKTKIVVATGGGMPCEHDNMEWMNQNGITVYLEAPAGMLFHRLANEKESRPLISNLSDIELMEFISGTLTKRKHYYDQSQLTVKADSITAGKLKEKIMKLKNALPAYKK